MTDNKLDHYNPNYTYKKEDITVDKNNKKGYPVIENVNNGAMFPEGIKNDIDMEQLKPLD